MFFLGRLVNPKDIGSSLCVLVTVDGRHFLVEMMGAKEELDSFKKSNFLVKFEAGEPDVFFFLNPNNPTPNLNLQACFQTAWVNPFFSVPA